MTQLTDQLQHFLLKGTPQGVPESKNPIEREGRDVFVKFDAITIEQPNDGFGAKVGFMWSGTVMCWIRVAHYDGRPGEILNLYGIEGRQRVEFAE